MDALLLLLFVNMNTQMHSRRIEANQTRERAKIALVGKR
jgi:hypothetical protein